MPECASRLVVAVCGGRRVRPGKEYQAVAKLAHDTGRALALNGGFDIVFGACPGYADVVIRSYLASRYEGSRVIGLSMWGSHSEHIEVGDPFYEGIEYHFLGKNRSIDIISSSDAVVFFPGSEGTRNEFSLAMIAARRPAFVGGQEFERELRQWMGRGLTQEQCDVAPVVERFEDSDKLIRSLLRIPPLDNKLIRF